MPSVGEYVRWDIPVVCPSCGADPATYETEPQAHLIIKIKCTSCNHSRRLQPQLTELGERIARDNFLRSLIK